MILLTVACRNSSDRDAWVWPEPGIGAFDDPAEETGNSPDLPGEPGGDDGDREAPGPEPPKFDLAELADAGALARGAPPIPSDCAAAEDSHSSVGCLFYTVDLDSKTDQVPFAAVVSNVQEYAIVRVSVERREAGNWLLAAGPLAIPPLSLRELRFADFHLEGTGINRGGAYRIRADRPIVAYQFNPIDGAASLLSDASMLYPVTAWDRFNHVVGWAGASSGDAPFLTVAAALDETVVNVIPSVATAAGPGVAARAAGQPLLVSLDAGDTLTINPADPNESLTGTIVRSDPNRPIALFSGHDCANIPAGVCCCDHLEEQLAGLSLWGRDFVATHMPYRDPADPEATLWQIYAPEAATVVELDHDPQLVGIPTAPLERGGGERVELFVRAPAGVEADFRVRANRPIAVLGYMIGSHNLPPPLREIGDPAMVQIPPVEQFLPRYVILVPDTWIHDELLLTRPAGARIRIDDVAISDAEFTPVADGDWEVARVRISDGVHRLDGDEDAAFGVVVVGWDRYDSYAYLGGVGTAPINPRPEG